MDGNMRQEYSFEVGKEYRHKVGKERKVSTFLCTKRDGDFIILEEVGGKGRTFSGEATRSEIWNGFNEGLEIGLVQYKGYKMVDHIVAHNFLEEMGMM